MKKHNPIIASRTSSLFLRAVIILIGLLVAALCVFVLPVGIRESSGGYGLILLGMYATVVPFFIALHQTLRLLSLIDQKQAFSDLSVRALAAIKYSALVISALYTAGLPYVFHVADKDDAPGVVVIGMLLAFAPFVIAVFAAVLQKLLQQAIALKDENDLTV